MNSIAEEPERKKIRQLEHRSFGTKPAAEETPPEKAEEGKDGKEKQPGKHCLEKKLQRDMKGRGRVLTATNWGLSPRPQDEPNTRSSRVSGSNRNIFSTGIRKIKKMNDAWVILLDTVIRMTCL